MSEYVSKRMRDEIEQRRIAAGLPGRRCPACNEPEPHWVPDSLTEAGHFACQDPDGPRSSGWYGGAT